MAERRPTNSELRLRRRLERDERDPEEERGILELFDRDDAADEDAPLARDDDDADE